jgi:hypothetical protein
MTTPPPRGNPDDKYKQPDAALGGADAVEKTTYVTGSGTDPERTRGETAPAAKGSSGTGPNATWAIIVFLAVGAVLVYLLGFGK